MNEREQIHHMRILTRKMRITWEIVLGLAIINQQQEQPIATKLFQQQLEKAMKRHIEAQVNLSGVSFGRKARC